MKSIRAKWFHRRSAGRIASAVAVAGMLLAASAGRVGGEEKPAAASAEVAALQAEIAALKGALPDQAHAMADVGYHFSNLWFAGQAKNWPLAQFYLGESKSHLEWAVRLKPLRKTQAGEIDLKAILQAIENSSLNDLKEALGAKDLEKFTAAYRATLEGCFGCHKASEKPYLRPQIPTAPPTTIINFQPDAAWPK